MFRLMKCFKSISKKFKTFCIGLLLLTIKIPSSRAGVISQSNGVLDSLHLNRSEKRYMYIKCCGHFAQSSRRRMLDEEIITINLL